MHMFCVGKIKGHDHLRPERPAGQFLWPAVRASDDEAWVKAFEDAVFAEEEDLHTSNVHGLSDVDALYRRLEHVSLSAGSDGFLVEILRVLSCVGFKPGGLFEEADLHTSNVHGLSDVDALYKRLEHVSLLLVDWSPLNFFFRFL